MPSHVSTSASLSEAVGSVIHTLREKADDLEVWGAHEAAMALRRAASLADERLMAALDEPLSLELAKQESGYSADHLGRLLRAGTIPNAGEQYAPRIRRRDLPVRPGHGCKLDLAPHEGGALGSTRARMARSVVASS